MLEAALFYIFSFGILLSAIGVVVCRSAIYSVLCLVAAMCMMAGLFILLKAFLVAAVLVLVYAGAILVLFLFVVMLIDFRKLSIGWSGLGLAPVWAVGVAGLVFLESFRVIRTVEAAPLSAAEGGPHAIGRLLFSKYLLPFELTSFLLLAAVVSVVVLAKKDPR